VHHNEGLTRAGIADPAARARAHQRVAIEVLNGLAQHPGVWRRARIGVADGVFSEASRVETKDLVTARGEDGLAVLTLNGPVARNAVLLARWNACSAAFDETRRTPTGAERRQAGEDVPCARAAKAERKP
jgi:hypothetical protein